MPATAASTFEIADVVAVGEIGGEQRLDHRVGAAVPRGVAHQAVGVDRGWRAADAVEAKGTPSARPISAIEA